MGLSSVDFIVKLKLKKVQEAKGHAAAIYIFKNVIFLQRWAEISDADWNLRIFTFISPDWLSG